MNQPAAYAAYGLKHTYLHGFESARGAANQGNFLLISRLFNGKPMKYQYVDQTMHNQ